MSLRRRSHHTSWFFAFPLSLTLAVLLSCGLVVKVSAEPAGSHTSLDRVTSARALPNGIEIHCGSAIMQVTALRKDLLRVRVGATGTLPEDASWAVLASSRTAQSPTEYKSDEHSVGFSTGALVVTIERNPLLMTVKDTQGNVVTEDIPDRPIEFHGNSFRVYKQVTRRRTLLRPRRQARPPRPPQRSLRRLEHRRLRLAGINRPHLQIDPLVHDLPSWRRRWHLPRQHLARQLRLRQRSPRRLLLRRRRWPARLLHPLRPTAQAVVEELGLAGRHNSPAADVDARLSSSPATATIPKPKSGASPHTLRSERIPADAICLDIDYQLKNRPFTVDPKRFPHFDKMIQRTDVPSTSAPSLITDLHIANLPNRNYKPYDEGIAGDHFVKNPDGSIYIGVVWPGPAVFPEFTRKVYPRLVGHALLRLRAERHCRLLERHERAGHLRGRLQDHARRYSAPNRRARLQDPHSQPS